MHCAGSNSNYYLMLLSLTCCYGSVSNANSVSNAFVILVWEVGGVVISLIVQDFVRT